MDEANLKHKESPPQVDTNLTDPVSQSPAKTKTLRRLNFSKPRARFAETTFPLNPKIIPESEENQPLYPYDDTSSTDYDDEWFEKEEENAWVVVFLVFLIEQNFMLREKVLYFVYGLRKSFQNCVWLGLVLICWMIMFPDIHKQNIVVKKKIPWTYSFSHWSHDLVSQNRPGKVLASSFHVETFFDRMKESVFHHYILDALSGPSLDETERELPQKRRLRHSKTMPARLREGGGGLGRTLSKKGSKRIDMEKLRKLSLEGRATAYSVKRLVNYVKSSGLSTILWTLDDFGAGGLEISSEWEARTCAQRIFKNVAKPGAK
ncbi:hypothetical protein CRYUN_Cryun08bG0053400 [Craigia yunnanensis]